jgi:NitT/TauT family transport system ATP-binding protein
MNDLVVEGLRLEYPARGRRGAFVALENIDLTARDGEFVAVVGPSGCGKSTMLMLIAALMKPTAGSVRLGGREMTKPGPDRALVFQDFALLPWRTALKNVELALELKRVPATERRETARRFLAMVGLGRFEKHYPHQLSGGMRQRVGIARALSVNPQVLLMDEPFGALDAQVRQVMGMELLRIWDAARKTILFVTHDIDEAIYLADRVIVMSASPGRIVRELTIDLPRPRALDLRNDPTFISYRRAIWDLLEDQVRASGSWMQQREGADAEI